MATSQKKKNYIPATDAAFAAWVQNFQLYLGGAGLTAAPSAYTAADATAWTAQYATEYATWTAAYAAWLDDGNRGKNVVEAKKNARAVLERQIRAVVRDIQGAVTDDFRDTPANLTTDVGVLNHLGLTVPVWMNANLDSGRHPTKPPSVPPDFDVESGPPGILRVNWHNPESMPPGERTGVSRKAKPRGVTSVQVAVEIAVRTARGMQSATIVKNLARTPGYVDVGSRYAGLTVKVKGRYVGTKDQVGPWSTEMYFVVPGEPSLANIEASDGGVGSPLVARPQ
jgi:hypothetical protein